MKLQFVFATLQECSAEAVWLSVDALALRRRLVAGILTKRSIARLKKHKGRGVAATLGGRDMEGIAGYNRQGMAGYSDVA
eukprot:2430355-Pleurochrysis_carterae.AAC.2